MSSGTLQQSAEAPVGKARIAMPLEEDSGIRKVSRSANRQPEMRLNAAGKRNFPRRKPNREGG